MTAKSLHKRSKMGMLPGDYPKQVKISMLEKSEATVPYSKGVKFEVEDGACKSFKKTLRSKERARIKESIRRQLQEG